MATRDDARATATTRATATKKTTEFWLTIPRATRRPDPTRAGAETIFYDVACALHGERGDGGSAQDETRRASSASRDGGTASSWR